MIIAATLLTTSVFAQDTFAPGNPTFGQFEETCRTETGIVPDCEGGIMGAYAEIAETDQIACHFPSFWDKADEIGGDVLRVLPWQTGVALVVSEPGVCDTTGFNKPPGVVGLDTL